MLQIDTHVLFYHFAAMHGFHEEGHTTPWADIEYQVITNIFVVKLHYKLAIKHKLATQLL